ncbi:hypothetical protein BH23THE1_BH23THE1_18640 [soil metagenome]
MHKNSYFSSAVRVQDKLLFMDIENDLSSNQLSNYETLYSTSVYRAL